MRNQCWYAAWLLAAGLAAAETPAPPAASSAEAVEFDGSLLQNTGAAVDVSRFRFGNPIPAGSHQAEVFVNGSRRGEATVRFIETGKQPMAGLCADEGWLKLLDVKPAARVAAAETVQGCVPAQNALPDLRFAFDPSNWRLDVDIPQALMMRRSAGYVPPESWQTGAATAFVRYRLNHYQYRPKNRAAVQYGHLGIGAGANWGGWALRHEGSFNWHGQGKSAYRAYQTHISRDMDLLKGRLTIGDFQTSGNTGNSLSLRGVSFASDSRMSETGDFGFVPVIRGVANGNARIKVRQNGRDIYETTVTAGMFELDNVWPLADGGDLEVEILEDDGSSRRFNVPYSPSMRLVRPGSLNVQAALGQYRDNDHVWKTPVFQGSAQYGVNNYLTLRGGITLARNYRHLLLGTAWNTPVGAIESDWAFTQSGKQRGSEMRLGFSKHFLSGNTYLNMDFRRFFSAPPPGLSEVLAGESPAGTTNRDKSRFSVSLSQNLGGKRGYLHIGGSSSQMRGHARPKHEYQIAYSNHYKNLQYQIGYSQARRGSRNGRPDNRVYINLSLPLDGNRNENSVLQNGWLSASHSHSQSNGGRTQAALNGTFQSKRPAGYHLSASRSDTGKHAVGGGVHYHAPFARLAANLGKSSDGAQWSASASGALVAHRHGLTASSELGDTFAVVRAADAGGAALNGISGGRLDRWGNGIVPYLSPYRRNRVGINPADLPDEVEIESTGTEVVPRAHSSHLVEFKTSSGKLALFAISENDGGIMPPMGAEVSDSSGKTVGYVVQGGRVFVRGIANEGRLEAAWGDSAGQRCHIRYRLSQPSGSSLLPQTVVCLPPQAE